MNKIFLIGRIGQNCEAREVSSRLVVSFSIATSERYNAKDGTKKEVTEWHKCSLWGDRAKALSPYLVKGKLVSVEGSVHYREVEKDGVKTRHTDIRVDNVELLGGGDKPAADRQPENRQSGEMKAMLAGMDKAMAARDANLYEPHPEDNSDSGLPF